MFDLNVNGTVVVGNVKTFVIGSRKVHELSIAIKYNSICNEVTEWIPAKYWTKADSKLTIPKGTTLTISGDLRTNTWKRKDGTTAKEVYVSIQKLTVIKWGRSEEPKREEPKLQILNQYGETLTAI